MIYYIKLYKRFITFFFIILHFSIICSCKQEDVWKGTIEKKNEITIVSNPIGPKYKNHLFKMEEDLRIGEKTGEEEYLFSYPRGIVVDNKMNIYVLDQNLRHIQVYNANGSYIQTIGRKGQGPGELSNPLSIHMTTDQEILICDPGNQRLNYYSLNGKFIRHVPIKLSGFYIIECIDSQTNIYSLIVNVMSMNLELNKYDKNLNLLQSFGACSIPSPKSFNPFSPKYIVETRDDDSVVIGLQSDYELKIYSSMGELIRIIRKKYSPVILSEKDIEEEKKNWENRNFIFPKYHNPFSTFSIDSDGRIFVKTHEESEEPEKNMYDVFDAEGVFIAKVEMRNNYFNLWKNHKLHTLEKDKEGYIYVKRYKVEWNY